MGRVTSVEPVRLFFGLLLARGVDPPRVHDVLAREFGPLAMVSQLWPFDHTDYYTPEMGPGIRRQFACAARLIDPAELPGIKLKTNEIESALADPATRNRLVNIDPGYVSLSKVVLASTKDHAHRLYLGRGIFGEVTLTFHRGKGFEPWPWTYPDYRQETTRAWFNHVRETMKRKRQK